MSLESETLVVPYFASGLDESQSSASASATPAPSPRARDTEIYSDSESVISKEGIEVSDLSASGERADVAVGDRIRIRFSLRNAGSQAVTLEETFIGARNPRGDNKDFAHEDHIRALAPGQAVKISGSIAADARGVWEFFPCYSVRTGGKSNGCPDAWRAFDVSVTQ